MTNNTYEARTFCTTSLNRMPPIFTESSEVTSKCRLRYFLVWRAYLQASPTYWCLTSCTSYRIDHNLHMKLLFSFFIKLSPRESFLHPFQMTPELPLNLTLVPTTTIYPNLLASLVTIFTMPDIQLSIYVRTKSPTTFIVNPTPTGATTMMFLTPKLQSAEIWDLSCYYHHPPPPATFSLLWFQTSSMMTDASKALVLSMCTRHLRWVQVKHFQPRTLFLFPFKKSTDRKKQLALTQLICFCTPPVTPMTTPSWFQTRLHLLPSMKLQPSLALAVTKLRSLLDLVMCRGCSLMALLLMLIFLTLIHYPVMSLPRIVTKPKMTSTASWAPELISFTHPSPLSQTSWNKTFRPTVPVKVSTLYQMPSHFMQLPWGRTIHSFVNNTLISIPFKSPPSVLNSKPPLLCCR